MIVGWRYLCEESWRNKLQKELERFPVVGLYEGETKEEWEKFVKYLGQIYKDIDGERRDIIEKAKGAMELRKEYFDDLLSDIGLTAGSSIRRIVNKLKYYIPCPEYKKWLDLEISYGKSCVLMEKYSQPTSDVKQKILEGMRKKYPEDLCQVKFAEVIAKNQQLVEQGKAQLEVLRKVVESHVKYQRLKLIQQELKDFINEWTSVDSGVGKENISKGKSFEDKCSSDGVGLILRKLKLSRSDVRVFMNVQWEGTPGEVDIAILDSSSDKILCLAECKSRLFDITQGYRQSGPDRSPEKTAIIIENKAIQSSRDVPCFVLTTLPDNEYFLGVESKLKGDLTKFTLDFEFDEIDFDSVYDTLRTKYQNTAAPIKWFNAYANTNLLVIL